MNKRTPIVTAIVKRAGFVGLALIGLVLAHMSFARADAWPSRPITLIVPFGAGTTSDIVGRSLAQTLSESLGQPVVVENKGGAGGNIGGAFVAHATPDGYTLLLATTGPGATNKLMYHDIGFDPERDFAPIVLLGKSPVIIAARPDAPFATLKDFIDYARTNPDKITAGAPGNGTLGHITGELLQHTASIKFSSTQYRGSSDILVDLLGSRIDIALDSMAAYVPAIQAGKIKALAIAGQQRWSKLPNVPTVSESGLPGFEASVWYALLAPKGVPPDVITKLNAASNAYLHTANTETVLNNLGVSTAGGTPDELKAFTASEIAKWGPIVKAANISF
ncbi:MAG TPA: tripartite tricarboxylate transporter substrate-binding protein [Xanthobacteraceae bacterium]|jgi:tripartite-type tricarboxylate transporter receptor subunit TctC|nr:tripartite tricarboxylate transporter substrate-binding protein [Xanthobacteraceae bacterium]